MRKSATPMPTDAELAILAVLWERGASTVREVHEELRRSRPAGYTTTLKQMQVMFEKRLLERDGSRRAHVYRPAIPEERTLRRIAGELLERVFGGSAEKLVMHALQAKKLSAGELGKIKRLIDEHEEGGR